MKVLLPGPEIQLILCSDFNVNFFSPLAKRRKVRNFIDVKGVLENKKDRLPKRATNLSSSLIDQLFCTIFDEVLKSRFLLQFIAKFYLKELFTEKLLLQTVTQWRQDNLLEILVIIQHEVGSFMQLWNPDYTKKSSRILENKLMEEEKW